MFHRRDEDSHLAMFHQRRCMTRITAGPTRTGIVSAIMKISLLVPRSNVASERTLSKGNKLVNNNNIWPEWQFFFIVAGYLYVIEESRRSTVMYASHEDKVLNKFRIWKERHVQMRENRASRLVGCQTHPTIYYCPGRGSNSRPPAHRSFKHGQSVPSF